MSSCLEEFILYKCWGGAIRAIPAISDPGNSKDRANSRGLEFVQNEDNPAGSPQSHHAYRFALRDGGGGGTYLTDAPDLESARQSLLSRYGDRLLLVVKAMRT